MADEGADAPTVEPGAGTAGSSGADNGSGREEEPYVHDPEGVRPHQAPPSESGFDWRGWLLVGVILFCFLVVPAAILYLPQAKGLIASLGLTLRDAYLVLPLIPAFLLGAVAVWAAVKSRG
jgi:hypothetical protein